MRHDSDARTARWVAELNQLGIEASTVAQFANFASLIKQSVKLWKLRHDRSRTGNFNKASATEVHDDLPRSIGDKHVNVLRCDGRKQTA